MTRGHALHEHVPVPVPAREDSHVKVKVPARAREDSHVKVLFEQREQRLFFPFLISFLLSFGSSSKLQAVCSSPEAKLHLFVR